MSKRPESLWQKLFRILAVLIVIAVILLVSLELQAIYPKHTFLIKIVTIFVLYLMFLVGLYKIISKKDKHYHIRGEKLGTYEKALKKSKKYIINQDTLMWGLLNLPSSIATTHFAVVGSTGSGKTVTLRLLMQSVLPKIGTIKNRRAIIYDAKQDILPLLNKIAPNTKVITLNPFDKRCFAWDMAKDVTAPATCQQLASVLLPVDSHEVNKYFDNTARHILSGILVAFNKLAPGKWTLRDIMVAIRHTDYIFKILSAVPEAHDRLMHFESKKTLLDVMSTFTTKMQEYEYIAAAWDRAEGKVNLTDWLNNEYILVLGNTEIAKKATDEINRVIFRRMTELLLSQTESTERQTWIFIDEVRQAGKLDSLNTLLTKGRSKGACIVLGFQDIDGLRKVYGNEEANELVGQCNNKALLKINSPETARWASSLFGDKEVIEERQSKNQTNLSLWKGSSSQSEQVSKKSVVMPSEFTQIPPADHENGITGFYIIPKIGSYKVTAPSKWLTENLVEPNAEILGIDLRHETDQTLRLWDEEDLKRLNLVGVIAFEKSELTQSKLEPALKPQKIVDVQIVPKYLRTYL